MPSHTKDNPGKKTKAPSWMKEWHVRGNDRADGSADTGAALRVVPRNTAEPLIKVPSNLKLFQERHSAIAKLLLARAKNAKIMQIELACQQSSHICIYKDNRVYCTECSMSVPVAAKHLFDLLQSPCVPTFKHISYTVGNSFTHHPLGSSLWGSIFLHCLWGDC